MQTQTISSVNLPKKRNVTVKFKCNKWVSVSDTNREVVTLGPLKWNLNSETRCLIVINNFIFAHNLCYSSVTDISCESRNDINSECSGSFGHLRHAGDLTPRDLRKKCDNIWVSHSDIMNAPCSLVFGPSYQTARLHVPNDCNFKTLCMI